MTLRFSALLSLLLGFLPALLTGQQADLGTGWNSERAIELIERAQRNRAEATADTGLLNYRADARAYVYFYLDRQDTGERNLVKTDQLALDVAWAAPDLTKQRIVGWRDRKSLPTNINYHIDHLAVVMENFGDRIRIGDGDEVENVLHPAASGTESFYDYRLVDSLTLRLPGAPEPVRVYELQVRPRDPSQPAFVGSVFVERREGDLVRMDFTFTPSSYRDRWLDYINISLDNGLWKGRFWLPNEQRVEIRRRIPELEIPAGSVIRGTMRVGNYRFNEELPPRTFAGPPVVLAPLEVRERFAFEEPIDAELREEGIGPAAELRDIRQQAVDLLGQRIRNDVGAIRPGIRDFSATLRYNRAEGAVVAPGFSLLPAPELRLDVRAGWAFGAEHPLGEVELAWEPEPLRLSVAGFGNRPRDVGIGPVASGAINSLSALVAARDYLDLFYASGVTVAARRQWSPDWAFIGSATWEAQRSADTDATFSVFGEAADFRPVRPVGEGTILRSTFEAARSVPAEAARWWSAAFRVGAGVLFPDDDSSPDVEENLAFLRPEVSASWGRRFAPGDGRLVLSARGGWATGELPTQELYLLGGRGTLPGYEFRAFGGDRYALADAVASAEVYPPWLRGRLLGALGWADAGSAGDVALARWGAVPTDGVRASLGVGADLFYDILHVDLFHGLGRGAEWELVIEAQRAFWDFL